VKLIVQIPCYNEEQTLPETVADIPRRIEGIDQVEILIIDDGSTDRTLAVARGIGVDHIVRNKRNLGLARNFRNGIDACLALGADIIVNTDGDNQYHGADIPKLVAPILRGEADIVIGDREPANIPHFSRTKKLLQRIGGSVVRRLAGIRVPDTVSGFRAFSREAAIRLNIVSSFSYTIETVIQAGKRQLTVQSIPVRTNPGTREPRLAKSTWDFILNSMVTMVRMYAMYQPLRVFLYVGTLLTLLGLIPVVRFTYFYLLGDGSGHIQSLILGGVLLMMGFLAYLVGLVADLIGFNRQLIEMALERVRRLELDQFGTDTALGSNPLRSEQSYETDETVCGRALSFRRQVSGVQADLLLFMDVLEHVEDDLELFRTYTEAAPGGSYALISVPAFAFLWSGHDVFLEHHRRYTLTQIETLVQRAGLRVVRGNYYFGLLFPVAIATRLGGRLLGTDHAAPKSQLRAHLPLVNSMLAALCRAELPLMRLNRLAGITAFCLARKCA
jgi:glycosyltransferase involved in cell wall biosynthesis